MSLASAGGIGWLTAADNLEPGPPADVYHAADTPELARLEAPANLGDC